MQEQKTATYYYLAVHPEIDGAKEYVAAEDAHERSIERQKAQAWARRFVAAVEANPSARVEVIA